MGDSPINSIRELLQRALQFSRSWLRVGRRGSGLTPYRPAAWMVAPLAGAALILLPKLLVAQSPAPSPTSHAAKAPIRAASTTTRKAKLQRRTVGRSGKRAAAVAPAKLQAPPKPNWPIDQPPTPAKVTWDSQGLCVEASNSSLEQIMREVTTDTGVKLQGLNRDERIFGNYGPGPAREVLSQLLDGSGYNVLMIGGSGDEPPQQIVLSPSAPASPQPANAAQSRHDEEENGANDQPQPLPEPAQPMPLRSPFGPGAQRVPLEMQQDMQIRQRQMEQQQENGPQ